MANRLALETSPYLLQHADNPVDWYPWGAEALRRATAEDRPILLSIGYSACHWCHVMAHESFEDPEIARIMNERFVNVKVDREERPDLDEVYMQAVQMMAGHGGWPMTVFLTPDGAPFYAGTYYPPEDRNGLPGLPRVLEAVADAYHNRRAEVERGSREIVEHLSRQLDLLAQAEELTPATLDQAFCALVGQFDAVEGGFGAAPKFPQPMSLEFALRTFHRTGDPQALWIVERSLEKMARGGVYDQLGGGFHRYAVDARWLVPHFEKMLYDNAQLSLMYLHAYQATDKPLYRRICEETLDYVRREMTDPAGGFYSTQDADSEGVEGKYYVWQPHHIKQVLEPEDADLFCRYYDVTPAGNWEETSILHVPRDAEAFARAAGVSVEHLGEALARGRARLLAARAGRVHPGRDEKILTAWNGLMLRSFAEAAAALDRADYLDVAVRNVDFLLARLREGRRLSRTWKDGRAKLDGYLEDYACLADGLLALYEATFDLRWLDEAGRLVETAIADFWDEERGGFFDVGRDHGLITRPKSFLDNAVPSGNSVAVDVLLRLALLAGDPEFARKASVVLQGMRQAMVQFPTAFGRLLGALDFRLSAPKEIAIVGDPGARATNDLLGVVRGRYLPNKVVALRHPGDEAATRAIPLLADRTPLEGRPTAYVCRQYTCGQPVTEPAALAEQLSAR